MTSVRLRRRAAAGVHSHTEAAPGFWIVALVVGAGWIGSQGLRQIWGSPWAVWIAAFLSLLTLLYAVRAGSLTRSGRQRHSSSEDQPPRGAWRAWGDSWSRWDVLKIALSSALVFAAAAVLEIAPTVVGVVLLVLGVLVLGATPLTSLPYIAADPDRGPSLRDTLLEVLRAHHEGKRAVAAEWDARSRNITGGRREHEADALPPTGSPEPRKNGRTS